MGVNACSAIRFSRCVRTGPLNVGYTVDEIRIIGNGELYAAIGEREPSFAGTRIMSVSRIP